ncbi:unnamed protein product [Brassicogethes aeneus]|uniref:Peptidase S1 domain-containing protein n=1 Tax=Brassicogethes aeneus TaxID=1431903 RepID=A0A9P0BAF0_BRAAE|nr:unnamed protein product [Brassicogethes aeneus]
MSYNTSLIVLIVLYLFRLKYLDAQDEEKEIENVDVSNLKFPHEAVMFKRNKFVCGGAILRNKFVIFPAHCFPKTQLLSLYTVGVSKNTKSQFRKHDVAEIYIHESYDLDTSENDLAIVRLTEAMKFDAFTNLVILSEQVLVDAKCLTVGYGSAHISKDAARLLNKNVTVVEKENCMIIGSSKICVEAEKSFCDAEYGNYVLCNNTLAGIFTTHPDLICTKTHVYTNVFEYKDWILQRLNRADLSLNVSFSVLCSLLSIIIILNY